MVFNLDQCPLCGTELSRIKFKEIKTRLQEEERKNAAQLDQAETATRQRLEQQYNVDLEKQKQAAERKVRTEAEIEIKKVAAERDLAAGKLKQAEAREVETRKQAQQELAKAKLAAEKKAKEKAHKKIKEANAHRDQLANQVTEIDERESALRQNVAEDT